MQPFENKFRKVMEPFILDHWFKQKKKKLPNFVQQKPQVFYVD